MSELAMRVYECDDVDTEAYTCLGLVTLTGSDLALTPEDGQDEALGEMIAMLRSTSVGAAMTPQEFIRTLPSRINPYMGYAVEEQAEQ